MDYFDKFGKPITNGSLIRFNFINEKPVKVIEWQGLLYIEGEKATNPLYPHMTRENYILVS